MKNLPSYTLAIVSKASQFEAIQEAWTSLYPDKLLLGIPILLIGPMSFRYPRGLKWRDFPRLSSPIFKRRDSSSNPLSGWTWRIFNYDQDEWYYQTNDLQLVRDLFDEAEKVVYGADPDHTDHLGFLKILRALEIEPPRGLMEWRFFTTCQGDLVSAIKNQSLYDLSDENENLRRGRVKEYFDWNYNQNSLAILTKAYQLCFPEISEPVAISKWMVQTLFLLEGGKYEPLRECDLIGLMYETQGSGKYKDYPRKWVGIGSAASRPEIFFNLVAQGFLTKLENRHFALSRQGQAFLDLIGRRAHDPDLPWRLDQWMDRGLKDCQDDIDRYIRTFFGRIKNRLDRSA